jgi:plasmid stabilization system protein ParE
MPARFYAIGRRLRRRVSAGRKPDPDAGHFRKDLTPLAVKFWPIFSYLVVYDPAARPVAIVWVLHGRQDVEAILGRDVE